MQEKKGPNGFLIGLLVGGAIGALVSSKRGRQILKDIAEYGLDYVGSNFNINDIDTILNEEEEMMEGEMEAGGVSKKSDEPVAKETHTKIYQRKTEEEPSRRKRLFKGIKK